MGMDMIARYEKFIEMVKQHREVFKKELVDLTSRELTSREERIYMNDVMEHISWTNTNINIAEHRLEDLKRNMES